MYILVLGDAKSLIENSTLPNPNLLRTLTEKFLPFGFTEMSTEGGCRGREGSVSEGEKYHVTHLRHSQSAETSPDLF